jgi:hypothetical protein
MYFPYLRARRHELYALRTLAKQIVASGKVVPILEPVVANTADLKRIVKSLSDEKLQHILIHNPLVGDLKQPGVAQTKAVRDVLAGSSATIHGFILGPETKLSEVIRFLSAFGSKQVAFIHWTEFDDRAGLDRELKAAKQLLYHVFIADKTTATYRKTFSNSKRVLVRDGFNPEVRNADYAPQEVFSELYLTYKTNGYAGCGDFLISGAEFRQGGGPAHAVAIHLTYEKQTPKAIWIRHCVSDNVTAPPYNTPMKFGEAVRKLVKFLDARAPQLDFSKACAEFRQLNKTGHYPGLGKVKELSMQHHIELMMLLL